MMRLKKILAVPLLFSVVQVAMIFSFMQAPVLAAPCQPGGSFFGLPTWYKYLDGDLQMDEATGIEVCTPMFEEGNDIWKVVAAVSEILLRVATLVSIGFIVYGGVSYVISQGAPDKTKQALQTIIAALVGLVISIVAAALVGFIAGRF